MLRRSVWRVSIITFFTAALALACASTPEEEGQTDLGSGGSSWEGSGSTSGGGSGSGSATGSGAIRGGTSGGAVVGTQDAETASMQNKLEPVYFDYDRSTLSPEAADTLKSHADTIRSFPEWAYVTIQGHCDERGTEEYNLALGDRRADAVKRYLVTLGVPESRLRTVSYGELRPAVTGHDESAWKKNRRAEFAVSR
jgi:peptidoglycan-associated lipoprotein